MFAAWPIAGRRGVTGPDRLGPFDPTDRPPCWVFHEGVWCRGRVHQWFPRDDGWTAMVDFEVGVLRYYQEVPAERLQPGEFTPPATSDQELSPPWQEQPPPWLRT